MNEHWHRTGDRLAGLRRFASAITILNLLGHSWLGFEQSYAHPVVALLTAYSMEFLLETVDAIANRRRACFLDGGFRRVVDFLLSAHISGLAISMLLYPGDRLLPVVFASAAAIGSKAVFRIRVDGRVHHVMNPSNFGLALTFALLPWVGLAPPYQFTTELGRIGDWVLPGLIVCSGTFLNVRFTRRIPLICGWVGGFVFQAWARSTFLGASFPAALMPMTGLAFVLFSFYMVTDPATTPSASRAQAVFGASVALAYGVLMSVHIVFGMFFALAFVCLLRGAILAFQSGRRLEIVEIIPAKSGAREDPTLLRQRRRHHASV